MEYEISWKIDLDADSPRDAVAKALHVLRKDDPENLGLVFEAASVDGVVTVDVSPGAAGTSADLSTDEELLRCTGCGLPIHQEDGVWVDHTGGDACTIDDGINLPIETTHTYDPNEVEMTDVARTSVASPTVRLLYPHDTEWPTQLADLGDDAPTQLWVNSTASLIDLLAKSVAIVGARAATSYGGHVASELGYALAGQGYTVVSGGAFGIDALAHRGALAADMPTIAVLGCGVDVVYPRPHDRLFARITEKGALISEYEPGSNPRPATFLARNRLIAALSQGTVVVEAAIRSGALNAARHAVELGRPLMAVPGPVTSAMSAGTHQLIRDGKARLVTSYADVLSTIQP
jgi:DNA protecting protein DprA